MKDNIIGGENPQRMVWTMTTPSNVTVVDAKTVTLTQGTKSCTLKILNPPDGEISVADNVPPPNNIWNFMEIPKAKVEI